MTYLVHVTETYVLSVEFQTKEEAQEWMEEPDYDMCGNAELISADMELVEVQ